MELSHHKVEREEIEADEEEALSVGQAVQKVIPDKYSRCCKLQ